jgi:type II secretory ATPase GspE/PulE/Tfp pilus assembly ATPase PilB-like protein
MGAENFLLSSTVNAVLAQRLVRRVCPECKETYEPPKEIQDEILKVMRTISENKVLMAKDPEVAKLVSETLKKGKIELTRGKGCPKCSNIGYKGRLGIFELLPMTDEISKLILENSPSSQIEYKAIEEGMLTLLQDGYLRAVEGVTTLEEVMRVSD